MVQYRLEVKDPEDDGFKHYEDARSLDKLLSDVSRWSAYYRGPSNRKARIRKVPETEEEVLE